MNDDIFLKKMKGVKPLSKDDIVVKKLTKNKQNKELKLNKKEQEEKENIKEQTKTIIKDTKFELSFGDINKDLKRGKIKIDRRIDLHGYSLIKAHKKFTEEVIKAFEQNKRCMLIITGKGNYKKNIDDTNPTPRLFYGKIKNSIIDWIGNKELKNYVLTYQNAGIEHGGDGAIFVYLRKKRF